MTQEQELQEVLKKNLPQQVSEVLRERLTQADRDAGKVKSLEAEIKLANEQSDYFKEQLEEYKKLDVRNALLESREKELETEKTNLEIEKLRYKLSVEIEKNEFTKSVALGLVRNTSYRKDMFNSKTIPSYTDANGNYQNGGVESTHNSETTTQE